MDKIILPVNHCNTFFNNVVQIKLRKAVEMEFGKGDKIIHLKNINDLYGNVYNIKLNLNDKFEINPNKTILLYYKNDFFNKCCVLYDFDNQKYINIEKNGFFKSIFSFERWQIETRCLNFISYSNTEIIMTGTDVKYNYKIQQGRGKIYASGSTGTYESFEKDHIIKNGYNNGSYLHIETLVYRILQSNYKNDLSRWILYSNAY